MKRFKAPVIFALLIVLFALLPMGATAQEDQGTRLQPGETAPKEENAPRGENQGPTTPTPPPGRAQPAPPGNASQCVGCHRTTSPGIVRDWEASKHGKAGVDCARCHGPSHAELKPVSAGTCGQCHSRQVKEFGDSKHAIGWDPKMTGNSRYKALAEPIQKLGCEKCHNIGYKFADNSVGRCDACHTRHTFSVEEAREPVACASCHLGPDHAQIEYFETSKHGTIYAAEGNTGRAPTCVTCHQPGGNHNVSLNLTFGQVSNGAVLKGESAPPIPMREITREEFEKNRKGMVDICSRCHSSSFATNYLATADEVKKKADSLIKEATDVIQSLYDDGLLPNKEKAVLGGQQLYSGTSQVESLFFKMYKYDHIHTFKGAYHMNPDYVHWLGWSEMQRSLTAIKSEAQTVRDLAALRGKGLRSSSVLLWVAVGLGGLGAILALLALARRG
ncbi:hypothetical protein SY88_08525 [Clostridiales bacterium PH28_bin88]|nr:hypothetical protein SY88_08525 [Clostridiales bacterium PH28_bin88]